ncbi:aldehyde dehydrogenase family protein [Euzebya tangerina]|uniref:aldehyde dehydrogenase family protein n=1 Tax=Euzebya tangerina TaxID=591198 RepID=UPI000E312DCC|nr:aldehyde dehydrogenase family protein [Euzebya tangerina]
MQQLESLTAGMPLIVGGDRVTTVPREVAAAFEPGDALLVTPEDGQVLHVPAAERTAARTAVDAAVTAFDAMGGVTDDQISRFFAAFADALADDATFAPIAEANAADVEAAGAKGRSTTRLVLDEAMREGMIEGLRGWQAMDSGRGDVIATVPHDGWRVEQVRDRLGVVAFVFEGRPNVFADACGVLRSGNTVVFRIGSDALGTARAIVQHALAPALAHAELPPGAASLVDSPGRAAGYALFSDTRLSLAVARGSGRATRTLGAVARLAGIPASLHGTGGAWIVAGPSADADDFGQAVTRSLDRKVCNTLNTCVITADRADELVPVFLDAITAAGEARGVATKLHVEVDSTGHIPQEWFDRSVPIARAGGEVVEPQAQPIASTDLGVEWEWEDSPEITLVVVPETAEAIRLFNAQSPQFVASLLATDPSEHERFFNQINAPFVGNGLTRWVDGQYALSTPELGLSNWEHGRLFGRGGILSGNSVFTVRTRAIQDRPDIAR